MPKSRRSCAYCYKPILLFQALLCVNLPRTQLVQASVRAGGGAAALSHQLTSRPSPPKSPICHSSLPAELHAPLQGNSAFSRLCFFCQLIVHTPSASECTCCMRCDCLMPPSDLPSISPKSPISRSIPVHIARVEAICKGRYKLILHFQALLGVNLSFTRPLQVIACGRLREAVLCLPLASHSCLPKSLILSLIRAQMPELRRAARTATSRFCSFKALLFVNLSQARPILVTSRGE